MGIEVVVLLVIVLGRVKFLERHNLRDNRGTKVLLGRLPGLFRDLLLLFVAVQDNGAIGRAFVRPLPVEGSGVVCLPEHLQYFGVRNTSGIKLNFGDLGMAGGFGAYFAVGR